MKKRTKVIIIILVTLIAIPVLMFVGLVCCRFYTIYAQTYNSPSAQPHTEWISEDKSICFEVDDDGYGYGTMILNGETFDIEVMTKLGHFVVSSSDDYVLYGYATYWKSSGFTLYVWGGDDKYSHGDEIKFYRIDE